MQIDINGNLVAPSFYKTDTLQTINYENQYACVNNSILQYLNYNQDLNTVSVSSPVNMNNDIITTENNLNFNGCMVISMQIFIILNSIYNKIPESEQNNLTMWPSIKYYKFLTETCGFKTADDMMSFVTNSLKS